MEPAQKKYKITDHFRVALKPQDINVARSFKKLKKSFEPLISKENVEIITISDDENSSPKKTKPTEKTKSRRSSPPKRKSEEQQNQQPVKPYENPYHPPPGLPSDVVDHDRTVLSEIVCESHYAWDSFLFEREQEIKFRTTKYMVTNQDQISNENIHKPITPYIRARLIDWLVQIQDIFSLYHETLYMAVKLADQYQMRKQVDRPNLQLLYMTSVLISVKFDERIAPVDLRELIQHSGGVYTKEQVISFEVDILTTLDFNIRFPLSYGFLRRFARCTGSNTKTLTLARYILESSLLEYDMIDVLESKMAAASLLLALEILKIEGVWTETAIFYTGYKRDELLPILNQLNDVISRPLDKRIATIRNKYSNHVFLSVAKLAPLSLNC